MSGSKWLAAIAMVLGTASCQLQLGGGESGDVSADEATTRPTLSQLLGTWLARNGAERFVFARTASGEKRWYRFAIGTCSQDELGQRVCPAPTFAGSGAFSLEGGTLTLRDGDGNNVFVATAGYTVLRPQPTSTTPQPNGVPAASTTAVRQALVLVFNEDYMGRPTMSYRRSEGETFCQPVDAVSPAQFCRDQVAQQPAAGGQWACTPRHDCAFVQDGNDGAARQRIAGSWAGGRTNPVGAVTVTFGTDAAGAGNRFELRDADDSTVASGSYRAAGSTLVVSSDAGDDEVYTFRIDGTGARRRITLFPVTDTTTLPVVLRPSTVP